jgi:hypothetical protein
VNTPRNPLLADIEAEHHNELLERGNLRKRRVVHAPWAHQPWESQGYVAHVIRSTCTNCGKQTDSLMGIFHVETRGTERQQQIIPLKGFQLPPPPTRAWYEVSPVSVAACLDCIPEAFLRNKK